MDQGSVTWHGPGVRVPRGEGPSGSRSDRGAGGAVGRGSSAGELSASAWHRALEGKAGPARSATAGAGPPVPVFTGPRRSPAELPRPTATGGKRPDLASEDGRNHRAGSTAARSHEVRVGRR